MHMNFDEALKKFKKGDKLLDYCIKILKPQILRVLKESGEYSKLHLNSCIHTTTKRFPKSDINDTYDSFDDLSLIDQYVAASLLSHLCFRLQIVDGFKNFDEYDNDSVGIEYDKFNCEFIFYSVYQYLSNGVAPYEYYVDMYSKIVKEQINKL